MKLCAIISSLLVLCSAVQASPTYLAICLLIHARSLNITETVDLQVHSYIDDLVRKALEYIRSLLRNKDPFPVPDLPQQTVTGDGIKLVATFNKLLVSNASDFTIDHIENNLFGMWAKFNVTVPNLNLRGGYSVLGTVNGKAVSGKGTFKLNVTELATGGFVRAGFQNWWLEMNELDIYYTVKNVEFAEEGLVVQGMTPQEIEALFSKSFLDYFQQNEPFVASQVASYVQGIANNIMHGKNLAQLIKWLENIISGNAFSFN